MPTPIEFIVVLTSSSITATIIFLACWKCSPSLQLAVSFLLGIFAGHLGLQWLSNYELTQALGEPVSSALTRTYTSFTQPTEARLWIPALLVCSALIGVMGELWGTRPKPASADIPSPGRTRFSVASVTLQLVWLLVFAAVTLRVLWGSVYLTTDWTALQTALIVTSIALAAGMISQIGRATRSRGVTAFQMLMTAGLFGFSGLIFLMSGSKTIGMLTLSGLGSGLALAGLVRLAAQPEPVLLPASPIVLGYVIHLMLAYFFAELTPLNALLLTLSLALIMAFGRFPVSWHWGLRLVLPVTIITVLLVTSTTITIRDFQKALQQQESSPYSSAYS